MSNQRPYSRRRLLTASGGVLSTVAIAGCTGAPTAEDGDEVDDIDEHAGDADDDTDEEAEEPDDDGMNDHGDDDTGDDADTDDGDGDADQEFVDMTGEDEVTVITREGDEDDGEGNFVFDPAFIRVEAGTTIVWENTDGVFHTVTSTDDIDQRSGGGDVFDAQITGEGDTFEWTAEETGEQPYYCSPHAGFMYGSIEIV